MAKCDRGLGVKWTRPNDELDLKSDREEGICQWYLLTG